MEYLVQFKRNGTFYAFRFPLPDAAQRFADWVNGLSNVAQVYCGPY